jgi:hypothetical protein
MAIVNEWQQVKNFPTPISTDLLFYEVKDSNIPRNENWSYGDPHPNKTRYPDHELIFVTPIEKGKNPSANQQWWYAAKRERQDDYNFELLGGEQLVRTYVVKRDLYFARPVGHASAVEGEFLYPLAGVASPDIRFTDYCFADDTQRRYEKEFDSVYVVIQRRFIRPITVSYAYDDQFKRQIRITKEIIPKTNEAPVPLSAGSVVEIQDGNNYHSVRITREVVLNDDETYPYQLTSIPATQDYRFPSKLKSIDLVAAWAYAAAKGYMPAYAEDFYFKPIIIDPRPGPYSATVDRYITDDPESIKAQYPITIIPQPVREAVAIVGWFWYASDEEKGGGNKASATAKEWAVPSTIHQAITVTINNNFTEGQAQPSDRGRIYTTIAATPGVGAFLALNEAIIDYKVTEMPFGLFLVSVVRIDCSNLYE